jgi:hypothetical protein
VEKVAEVFFNEQGLKETEENKEIRIYEHVDNLQRQGCEQECITEERAEVINDNRQ